MLLAGSGGRGVIIVDMLKLSIKQCQNYAEPDVGVVHMLACSNG